KTCGDVPRFKRGSGYSSSAGTLNTGCAPLVGADNLGLIQRSYVRFADGNPHPHWPAIIPIQGGPAWIRSELFNISVKASGNPSQEMMEGPMMQALLEERFQLKMHRETREVPMYALTAAPGGLQLPSFQDGCIAMPSKATLPAPPPGQQYCKVMVSAQSRAVYAQGSTLTEFSQLLSLVLDRPVIDKTGITGKFDIHLEFSIDQATPRFLPGGDLARFAKTPDPAVPSIFTAIQGLGLKLEAAQGPREFLVIDHIEMPREN
ncbi:MAG: TIGR03435 family protein, partial [Bryobacteraceae bacterium]